MKSNFEYHKYYMYIDTPLCENNFYKNDYYEVDNRIIFIFFKED